MAVVPFASACRAFVVGPLVHAVNGQLDEMFPALSGKHQHTSPEAFKMHRDGDRPVT